MAKRLTRVWSFKGTISIDDDVRAVHQQHALSWQDAAQQIRHRSRFHDTRWVMGIPGPPGKTMQPWDKDGNIIFHIKCFHKETTSPGCEGRTYRERLAVNGRATGWWERRADWEMPRLLASSSDGTRAGCSSSSLVRTIAYKRVRSIYNVLNEMLGASINNTWNAQNAASYWLVNGSRSNGSP